MGDEGHVSGLSRLRRWHLCGLGLMQGRVGRRGEQFWLCNRSRELGTYLGWGGWAGTGACRRGGGVGM